MLHREFICQHLGYFEHTYGHMTFHWNGGQKALGESPYLIQSWVIDQVGSVFVSNLNRLRISQSELNSFIKRVEKS